MRHSGPSQNTGGTLVHGTDAAGAVTPPERALIVAYRGVGLSYAEISTLTGRDEETVKKLIYRLREAAREADDPLDVFSDAIGPALAADPDIGGEP